MKRFLVCLLLVTLMLSFSAVGASAYELDAAGWGEVQLHALIGHNGDLYSELAEDYFGLWWEEEIPELDGEIVRCSDVNMRGFTMSANGEYAYFGMLNGDNCGVRGVLALDMISGEFTDMYYKHNEVNANVNPFSYPKGLAADDRGYVYVGFAYSKNFNVLHLGIAQQMEDGTLEEKSYTEVCNFGTPGDETGTNLGVNGVDVVKIDEKYYCYVMANYTHDALYCYDVTDPANPVLNTEFGTDGAIRFSDDPEAVAGDGFTLKEGQYLDVDDDGTIWLVVNSNEGPYGIMRISADGKLCEKLFLNGTRTSTVSRARAMSCSSA